MVDNITKAIDDLQNKIFAKAQDLVNQVQLIAVSLPFAHRTPEVRAITPFVAPPPPQGVDDLAVHIAGIFPDADLGPKYWPYLTINEKPYPSLRATAEEAEFRIAKADLTFPGGEAIRNIPFRLVIPYKGRCAAVIPCRKQATLPEAIGLMPKSPGNLHISFTYTTQNTETKTVTSYPLHIDAGDGDHNPQALTYQVEGGGWEIIPASVQLRVLNKGGDADEHSGNGNCSTTTMACWHVTVIQHHCFSFICLGGAGKGDGSLTISLTFQETRTEPLAGSSQEDIPISWGQTVLKTEPSKDQLEWVAVYTDFNNTPHAFGSNNSNINSPYLKETSITSNTLAFSVYPFGADAGADLSGLVSDVNAPVLATLHSAGLTDAANFNPLTASGFKNLKASMLFALGNTIPDQHAGVQGNDFAPLTDFTGLLLGDIVLAPGNRPGAKKATAAVPVSAQQDAFGALKAKLDANDHM
jgi:hypothetical protein